MYSNLLRDVSYWREERPNITLDMKDQWPCGLNSPGRGWTVSYWPAVIKWSEQPDPPPSISQLSGLHWLTDWLTDVLGSFCFQLFQVQLVSSVSSVMQFSGSSDHINHLSSNFTSPLLLIEQKYRHWSQFYFKKLVPAWHPTPCLLPATEKLPLLDFK